MRSGSPDQREWLRISESERRLVLPKVGSEEVIGILKVGEPGHGFDFASVIDATKGVYYGMKGGDIPESNQNCARYQTDDYSMVVCWNRSDIGEGAGGDAWWYPDFPEVLGVARSSSWGRGDLFPGFGMPALVPRRPWWRPPPRRP